jgi:flagellar biogenesis protein FliO
VGSPLGDYLIQSVALLVAIGALGGILLFAARRKGVGRAVGPVELLARLPLEARRSVYVVRILDQVLILGSSEAGLAKLGELPESSAGELRAPPAASSFAAVLAAARGFRESDAEEPRPRDAAGRQAGR